MFLERVINTESKAAKTAVGIFSPLATELYYGDLKEAQDRRILSANLESIFDKVNNPNIDIKTAVVDKLITQEELDDCYHGLTDFIKSDTNNARIILYLPFELLPDLNNPTETPTVAELEFAQTYKSAWIQLLFESEVRADFNDGDVLEPGLASPTKVRKAAHLIPEITKKGIISMDDINLILEINSHDEELVNSIKEGLTLNEFAQSPIIFDLNQFQKEILDIEEKYKIGSLNDSGQTLEQKYQPDIIPSHKMSRERLIWKRKQDREKVFSKYAASIKDTETIVQLLDIDNSDPAYKIVGLKAIFNQNQPTDLYWSLISQNWRSGDSQIRNTIISGLNYWQKNGINVDSYLKELEINLVEKFDPINLTQIIKDISHNPVLMENIYPILLSFGSRVKGYASPDSDQDIAIFFRPNVDFEIRQTVLAEIKKIPQLDQIGRICEFWTKENNGKIVLKHFSDKIWGIVGPEQIYYIFGGLWIGDSKDIKNLRQNFLDMYQNLSSLGDKKDLARFQLLRQLEKDALQYRFMHKGFRKFYPDKTNPRIKTNQSIDGESTFWDPKYRQIATKLFLSNVFLPDLA